MTGLFIIYQFSVIIYKVTKYFCTHFFFLSMKDFVGFIEILHCNSAFHYWEKEQWSPSQQVRQAFCIVHIKNV